MVELVENKSHILIKRNGTHEVFDPEKLKAVILWAASGSEAITTELLEAINIKIHSKMQITKLYDEVINTAANKISDLFPVWETVARNLYLLKIHKDIGEKRAQYPKYSTVCAGNITNGFYDYEMLLNLDLEVLDAAINPEYDNLFTFGGLNLFVSKYCNKTDSQLLELPQHTYLRVAIQLMHKDGIDAIISKYHQIASHDVTEATPKMVNALKKKPQLFSCCLARPEDSLESINEVDNVLGKESKFGGGLATDFSAIRTKGSHIEGNKGQSGGVIPFIQKNQWSVGAYNQGNTRSSSEALYYNWFHFESPEITMLKDKSGKDDERARKLKYAVKWTQQFSEAIRNDEEVWLFDPHKTQDMTFAWGDDLRRLYDKYSNMKVRKRKYKARDLAFTLAKMKAATGNNYTFFTDNANSQNIGGGVITQSNLCMEYLPNFEPIRHVSDELKDGKVTSTFTGDIALCNLASINLINWQSKSYNDKVDSMRVLVRSMNNAIDNSFYSNKYGQHHSFRHRNLGIGVSNYANFLATNKLKWEDEGARRLTHELFEEISFLAIGCSVAEASEHGAYPLYEESKWAQGLFPHELSVLPENLRYPLLQDWEGLRARMKIHGIRNEYLLAIAPTATSGLCINATPGVDAPLKLKTIEEGTYSLPFVVPNLKENREFYQTRYQVANKDTLELAAIRQRFIDMGQSVSLSYKNPNSAYDIINDTIYAEELGLKTLYYTNTPAADDLSDDEVCESCSA